MYCKNCGQPIDPGAAVCVHCGYANGTGTQYCPCCGRPTPPGTAFCSACGARLSPGYTPYAAPPQPVQPAYPGQKSKLAAVLLCLFLGTIGVHDFYLGFTGNGVLKIVLTLVTCGIGSTIWMIVDLVRLLTGEIGADADGIPLHNEF